MTGAIILAAGPGTRLGDLGARIPKTMLPVAGRPYLEHLVSRLLGAGLRPVVVAVHHHADMIREHFNGDRSRADLLFVHTNQRGTGSDLLECLGSVPTDAFIVWNGDTIVELDVPDLLGHGERAEGGAIIVLTRRLDAPNNGAWYVDANRTIIASLEAVPKPVAPIDFTWRGSSTGVLLLRKSLLTGYQARPAPDLYSSILPLLIARRKLKAYDNGRRYFLDFGTPQNLARIDHKQVASWA